MTGRQGQGPPPMEETMVEIRAAFERIHESQRKIIELVFELAELRGVDLSSCTGPKLG